MLAALQQQSAWQTYVSTQYPNISAQTCRHHLLTRHYVRQCIAPFNACSPVILQVKLTYLLQKCPISSLSFQIIHLLSGHNALVGHVQSHQPCVGGLAQHKISCIRVADDVGFRTWVDIAVAEESASQDDKLLLQRTTSSLTKSLMECSAAGQ